MKPIKTKRLRLEPMTLEELNTLRRSPEVKDKHLRQAYNEMARGAAEHPKQHHWYTYWRIFSRKGTTPLGGLCFKGPPQDGAVELGYGIDEPERGRGYATEAVRGAVLWALSQGGAYLVTAETEKDNAASRRVLERNGFTLTDRGPTLEYWEKERAAAPFLMVYISIGLCSGLCLGLLTGYLLPGFLGGLLLWTGVGVWLMLRDKKKRAAPRAARLEKRKTR